MRALTIAFGGIALAAAALGQIEAYNGPSRNIAGPAIDFDHPFVPSGPVPPNLYAGTGITSVTQVGTGWSPMGHNPGVIFLTQMLGSEGGQPIIWSAGRPLDSLLAGDGWEVVLDQSVDEFQFELTVASSGGLDVDVELFQGALSLGAGNVFCPPSPSPVFVRAASGPFDRVRITAPVPIGARAIDDLAFGHGPAPARPANDECATRQVVGQGATAFSTVYATPSPEPVVELYPAFGDVWFEYTTVGTGLDLQLDVCSANYDTALEIYTGSCGALSLVTSNRQFCGLQSGVVLHNIVPGTTYVIRVGGQASGYTMPFGAGALHVTESPPPAVGPNCLQTLFAADAIGALGGAVYFDLAATQDLEIFAIELNTPTLGPIALAVYTIPGTYVGNAGNAGGAGWTLATRATGVGLGHNQRTSLDLTTAWQLPAGTTGVALVGRDAQGNSSLAHDYTLGTGANQRYTSGHAYLGLQAGAADDVPWSGALKSARVWNGHLCFRIVDLGAPYCTATVNSTGSAAAISADGSDVVADNDLRLRASDMPFNSFMYFLTSRTQGFVANPGGSLGNLCLGGAIGRYVGPGQIKNTRGTGQTTLQVDLTHQPTPTGSIAVQPGETWNFQAWFREVGFGSATSNLTNGREVTFR